MDFRTASCRVLFIILFAATPVSARTWHVRPDGTGNAPTIQAAVDSATAGDTVLVAPGRYTWTGQGSGDEYGLIRFNRGKTDFIVKSEAGPELTIIDGEWKGRVIYIQGGDNNQVTIDGLSIERGVGLPLGDFYGGGLIAHLSSPIIRNCVFRDNTADRGGAVYYAGVSGPHFENCLFMGNRAGSGAAIYLINSSLVPVFSHCVIRDNTATGKGGAIYAYHFPMALDHCVILNNEAEERGGAIYCEHAYPSTIASCTIVGNRSGEGSALCLAFSEPLAVRGTIVAFNDDGPPFVLEQSAAVIGCCDIYGNAVSDELPPGAVDDGNLMHLDPLFCGSPSSGNLSLRGDSPCTAEAQGEEIICGLIGANPVGCGSVSTDRPSWGDIKSRFRR